MAGIGFELKRLFRRKGIAAAGIAYGYAGVLCTGPLLLGILLQVGLLLLCSRAGASRDTQELLVCMMTYTLLGSLLVTSFVSMPLTRFWADMLYQAQQQAVLPALWGANALLLLAGCGLYGTFLLISGASFVQGVLCLWLFAEMIVNWNAISCLTAIKDYTAVLRSYGVALAGAWPVGYGVVFWLHVPPLEGLLFAVAAGYGGMLVQNLYRLHSRFPQQDGSPWQFLHWMDRFSQLAWTGLLLNIGLFGHLLVLWAGPLGVQVKGLFYGAPYYDVPALLAFLSILPTTVNFVVSMEVTCYPVYRAYCSLFNEGGTIGDIALAEKQLLAVLRRELWYTALKQLFVTAAVISLEGTVLGALPLGFNDLMHGCFRTLCIGYGLYAVSNMVVLLLLYLTDDRGAAAVAAIFAAASVGLTAFSLYFDPAYYGFGFLLGATVFCLAALLRLDRFAAALPYHILGSQPLTAQEKIGCFTRLARWLERTGRENACSGSRAEHAGRNQHARH